MEKIYKYIKQYIKNKPGVITDFLGSTFVIIFLIFLKCRIIFLEPNEVYQKQKEIERINYEKKREEEIAYRKEKDRKYHEKLRIEQENIELEIELKNLRLKEEIKKLKELEEAQKVADQFNEILKNR